MPALSGVDVLLLTLHVSPTTPPVVSGAAPAQHGVLAPAGPVTSPAVIEILTFRLAAGADETDFLEADRAVQTEFAYQQPGLLRRTTARGADGSWLVIDIWRSLEDADACNRIWGQDEWTSRFMSLVDTSSVRTARYEQLD